MPSNTIGNIKQLYAGMSRYFLVNFLTYFIVASASPNNLWSRRKVIFEPHIYLEFTIRSYSATNYWTLDKATAEFGGKMYDLLMKWTDAPTTRGYKCSNMGRVLASKSDPRVEFVFHGLQVQPFGITNGVFTEADDCVGFMSPEIFSSLFVIFLLLGIFAYGFVMLMGIQSNDTFDDPKHKMIQLGGSTE
ncbi:hypothetical protein ACTXT7_009757 [Hymenolepis weldensis]